jgi:hypothetical protein
MLHERLASCFTPVSAAHALDVHDETDADHSGDLGAPGAGGNLAQHAAACSRCGGGIRVWGGLDLCQHGFLLLQDALDLLLVRDEIYEQLLGEWV